MPPNKNTSLSSVTTPSTRLFSSRKAHCASASEGASTHGIPNRVNKCFTCSNLACRVSVSRLFRLTYFWYSAISSRVFTSSSGLSLSRICRISSMSGSDWTSKSRGGAGSKLSSELSSCMSFRQFWTGASTL